MFIQDVSIKNFRCYKDEKIAFKSNPTKNIVLLTGKSDAGKTSLLNAIGWCLYGQETQILLGTKPENSGEKEIPNEKSYDSGRTSKVSVRLTIKIHEIPQMDTIVVKREAKFIKGNPIPVYSDPSVEVYDKSLNVQHYPDPNQLLSYIRPPKNLANFYLFDGEFLKQTQKFDAEVNTGFSKLFKIDTFKEVGSALMSLYSDYSSDATKATNITEELQRQFGDLNKINEKIKENSIELQEMEKRFSEMKKERAQAAEDAKTTLGLVELKVKYEKVKAQRDSAAEKLKERSNELRSKILQNAYLINANTMMNEAKSKIETLEGAIRAKKSKLIGMPPTVQEIFLENLLSDGMCVCGRPLEKDSHEHKHIEELLPKVTEMNEREFLMDLLPKLDVAITTNKKRRGEIDNLNKQVKDVAQEFDKIDAEKNQILSKNQDIEKELVQNPVEKMEWLDGQMQQITSRKEKVVGDNDYLGAEKSRIEGKIAENKQTESGKTEFLKKMEITDTLSLIINAFSKQAVDKFSELLETEINALLAANEKLATFKCERKVESNDEVVFTLKEVGSEKPYTGGGLSQLKGIILIAAFTRIIERVARAKVPIPFVIMDHPISDLDTEGIKKIAAEMGEMFHNSQVILFVADTKYDVFKTLAKEHIANRFLITNNRTARESHIEEI